MRSDIKRKLKFVSLFTLLFVLSCATVVEQQSAVSVQTAQQSILSPALENPSVKIVGFDIDDTILFSTPAFDKGYASGHPYGTEEFWEVVNSSDEGNSIIKKKTLEILNAHKEKGHEIYFVTSRNPAGGETLQKFLSSELGIPEENIIFAPGGKTEILKKLGIDAFYGDSDSDIRYAIEAGAIPIRILRSPDSSYKGSHNPGY